MKVKWSRQHKHERKPGDIGKEPQNSPRINNCSLNTAKLDYRLIYRTGLVTSHFLPLGETSAG